MIISKPYAQRLIRSGKADEICVIRDDDGKHFHALQRRDVNRVDHVFSGVYASSLLDLPHLINSKE